MIRYECDRCGVRMEANDGGRFIVRMEIFAAAEQFDLDAQTSQSTGLTDVLSNLARADPDEIEDQTYRLLRFDVCNACRRALLAEPLRRGPPS